MNSNDYLPVVAKSIMTNRLTVHTIHQRFKVVTFCPVTFCLRDILSPWHFVLVTFCPLTFGPRPFCPTTLTNLPITSLSAGAAVETAALRKNANYADLTTDYMFLPLAFESFGHISLDAQLFIRQLLGRRISGSSGDIREERFSFQRLSITI